MEQSVSLGIDAAYPDIRHPWVFFRLNEGLTDTSADEITSSAYGSGAVDLGAPLTFQDTVGTAWSSDDQWVTLDGSEGNAFSVEMSAIDQSWIVQPNGGLLVWGQINSNLSGGSNPSPMLVGLGNANSTTAPHAMIRFGVDRANDRDRVQTNAVGSTTVNTLQTGGTPLSDNTTHLLAYYVDMVSGNLRTYVDGALRVDASSQVDVDDFQAMVSQAPNVSGEPNFLTVGCGPTSGASTYPAAVQWEGKLRRVGMMAFVDGPSNLDTLMQALSARGGIPGREFVF